MTYKNIFSFEPSELDTAEELIKNKYEVYFPIKDEAVDLIAVKNLDKGKRNCISIQVKASRMWEKYGQSKFWIKFDSKKLLKYSKKVDFYVFVFYETIHKIDKIPNFRREFIVIPTNDLIKKSKNKREWKKKKLHYDFTLDPNGTVFDLRGVNKKNLKKEKKKEFRNYTKYKNAFHLLK